jgi:hypothetical protein
MWRWCFIGLLLVGGCGGATPPPLRGDDMFAPQSMRLHPIFTSLKDWSGDKRIDGIEAEVEFLDAFGDPTKAAGRIIFELYEYREGGPDPRGARLVNPWVATIANMDEQRLRWNRTSRTYSFQLAMPGLRSGQEYVLTAMFEPLSGPRMFDRMILKGRANDRRESTERKREPSNPPATQPGGRTPEP